MRSLKRICDFFVNPKTKIPSPPISPPGPTAFPLDSLALPIHPPTLPPNSLSSRRFYKSRFFESRGFFFSIDQAVNVTLLVPEAKCPLPPDPGLPFLVFAVIAPFPPRGCCRAFHQVPPPQPIFTKRPPHVRGIFVFPPHLYLTLLVLTPLLKFISPPMSPPLRTPFFQRGFSLAISDFLNRTAFFSF